MHRNSNLREQSDYFDSLLPDQESLLIQLCNHLFKSGFVFDDSSQSEKEAGGWVIYDFFEQEADVIRELVSRERYEGYSNYVKNFNWPAEKLIKKLVQRITRAFDQLAKGSHHHFNIRYNISHGLRQDDTHPLYDLLLYVETYFSLVLDDKPQVEEVQEDEPDFSTTDLKIEDLFQLRSQVQARIAGRELVKGFLKHIAIARGVSVDSLVSLENKPERQFPPIQFVRPSLKSTPDKISTKAELTEIFSTEEIPDSALEQETVENADELFEIPLETDVDDSATEPAEEKEEENDKEVDSQGETLPENDTSIKDLAEDADSGRQKIVAAEDPPESISAADLLSDVDEDEDEEDEEDGGGLLQIDSDETDVVFGTAKIGQASMEKFVLQYPDSTLKFLLRRNIDGRPLALEIEAIHSEWEDRGLSRGRLKKYLLNLMEWSEVPNLPVHDLLQKLRNRLYEVSHSD
ncbi:MAG: hypothetical protein H8E38_05190 [SAR324 cluster bacterium]|nr:hypothetical protein [SAR324 cluster bacterium]MBL7034101.1 hypothetical protein [SAR324 cluster bacterium]